MWKYDQRKDSNKEFYQFKQRNQGESEKRRAKSKNKNKTKKTFLHLVFQ